MSSTDVTLNQDIQYNSKAPLILCGQMREKILVGKGENKKLYGSLFGFNYIVIIFL